MSANAAGVPEDVRRLAVSPFSELPAPPDVEVIRRDGYQIGFNPYPNAQMAVPLGDGPPDLAAAVEETRAWGRERGKATLAWWIAPEHDHLAAPLEACGIVNKDTPGFEATENALVLVAPPSVEPAAGVEVHVVETFEDYVATAEVARAVFGLPDMSDVDRRARYEEYRRPENPGRSFVAKIDGRAVGAAYAAYGDAGVNLFGGAVVPEARSRGIYRALILARWEVAVERGTPALTVQAGRMSRPILEHVGFEFVAASRVFVDELDR